MDDVPEIRDLVATILSAQGYEVDVASDGVEALRCLDKSTYDLIVSDMRMSGLDGPGLYHELQRRDPDRRPRLLFVSGSSSVQAYAEFFDATPVPVLEKPFKLDDLCRVVERMLAGAMIPAEESSIISAIELLSWGYPRTAWSANEPVRGNGETEEP